MVVIVRCGIPFKIKTLVELRKILIRKKLFDTSNNLYGLGIAQPLRYPDSADLPNLQR